MKAVIDDMVIEWLAMLPDSPFIKKELHVLSVSLITLHRLFW